MAQIKFRRPMACNCFQYTRRIQANTKFLSRGTAQKGQAKYKPAKHNKYKHTKTREVRTTCKTFVLILHNQNFCAIHIVQNITATHRIIR